MIDHLFEQLADALGTNAAIIIFTLIAFVPLAYQMPTTVIAWQAWLSQTAIQLIALAVLQKGQRLAEHRTRKMLKETHDTVMQEMQILKTSATGGGANVERRF